MIVGRNAPPPFVRELTARDLTLCLDQSLAFTSRGDVLVVAPDNSKYVLMPIERFDQLTAANNR
jgi:hypothetical protein